MAGRRRALRQLYAASLPPGRATLLPKAWRADARGDHELLIVVLANAALEANTIAGLRDTPRGRAATWITSLRVPKSAKKGR